jgi:hypothetical protein
LLQLLRIEQPKLLLQTVLEAENSAPGRLEVVWDPLADAVEAVPCPVCGKPSYDFALGRSGHVGCEACKPNLPGSKPARR